MEDVNVLKERFLKVQKLFNSKKKNKIKLALEILDGMYKEYSAINWIENVVSTKAEDEKLQMLHYVYKEAYAFQLIDHYNLLLTVVGNEALKSDEPSKYKADLDEAYSHVEFILEEMEALEKAAPNETLKKRLQLDRSQCNEFYSIAIKMIKYQDNFLNMSRLTPDE